MLVVLVVLAPLIAALLPLTLPLPRRPVARVTLAAVAALTVFAIAGVLDPLSRVFAGLVSSLGVLAVLFSLSRRFFRNRAGDLVGEDDERAMWSRVSVYFALLGTFWCAMLTVVVATNFTMLWLGISATTLATAFLVAFSAESDALEAAWKYLILCSVGIAFALVGILLLAHVAIAAGMAPADATSWNAIVAHAPVSAPPLARLAIALTIVGFATKAGLVPMHAWLPDAHSKAPPPVSALLSGVLVSCALYALFRTVEVAGAFGCDGFARACLLWLGGLSTIVAASLMLAQTDLKRLLAYSTVEHAGIVALALGFGGPLGEFAAVLHVLSHGFSKAGAFFAVGLVQAQTGTTSIGSLHGLWRSGPGGRLLLAALGALAGLPPFGLFVSEVLVIAAGVTAGRWWALAAGVFGIGLAFAALARTAIAVESGAPAEGIGNLLRARAPASAAALALAGAFALAFAPWGSLGVTLRSAAGALTGAP